MSDIFEQLKARQNLPEEFLVLSKAIKNMKGGNLNIDVNQCSWLLRENQKVMCEKWMKLLSFSSFANTHDHYVLQKMDEYSIQYNVRFADLSSQIQKLMIQENLGEHDLPPRVQRKM